jgi:hypothetical protein
MRLERAHFSRAIGKAAVTVGKLLIDIGI